MEEAQSGGLIDKYWIFNVIVMPLLIALLLIGIIHFIGTSCPFKEDVSGCFPYNLPAWAKIVVPFALIIIPIILLILVHKFGGERK